jgi:hypothetical protein
MTTSTVHDASEYLDAPAVNLMPGGLRPLWTEGSLATLSRVASSAHDQDVPPIAICFAHDDFDQLLVNALVAARAPEQGLTYRQGIERFLDGVSLCDTS